MIDGHDPTTLAVFDGGPGDGHEHIILAESQRVSVSLTDCSWHLYVRVPVERTLSDGRRAVVLQWRGRC